MLFLMENKKGYLKNGLLDALDAGGMLAFANTEDDFEELGSCNFSGSVSSEEQCLLVTSGTTASKRLSVSANRKQNYIRTILYNDRYKVRKDDLSDLKLPLYKF